MRDVQKMIDRRAQRTKAVFLFLHLLQMGLIGRLHLRPGALLMVCQYMRCLLDQSIGLLQGWPQSSCRL